MAFLAGIAIAAGGVLSLALYIHFRLPGWYTINKFADAAGQSADRYNLPPSLFVPTGLVIVLLLTAIHEIGHLIGIKLVKWQLGSLNIAGLSAKLTHSRWEFSYSLGALFRGSAGFFLRTPSRFRHKLRVVILAGPLANLLSAITCFILVGFMADNYAGYFLRMFAEVSLFIGLFNLLPFRFGNAEWDGFVAFRGLRSPEWHRARLALGLLTRAQLNGLDRSLWNQRWFTLTKPVGKPYLQQIPSLFLHYTHYLSTNNDNAAAEMLERALSASLRASPSLRAMLYCQAAYFQAVARQDDEKAVIWKERIKNPALLQPYMRLSLDAALEFSRRDMTAFEAATAQARDAALALPLSAECAQTLVELDRESERLRALARPQNLASGAVRN